MSNPRALILRNHLCPGDVLAMTAAIYSLHKAHPGKYLTAVESSTPAIWQENPDIATPEQMQEAGGGEVVETHYPAIQESNQRAIHFMQAYCEFFAHALQVKVPLATNRPMVYLSRQEKEWLNQVQEATGYTGKFWLICAGRKADFTSKFWGTANFQRVVDILRGRVLFVQVGSGEHYHPALKNVIDFVGKTDHRQLMRLVYHAEGVLCGVTYLHHLAAAFEKPSVVVMGGREPVPWNAYPKCQLLHTIGALPCCHEGGCWKSRVVRLGDGAEQDQSLCNDPVLGGEPIPRCLELIRPEYVAETILRQTWHGAK